jgi:hypothetical protein
MAARRADSTLWPPPVAPPGVARPMAQLVPRRPPSRESKWPASASEPLTSCGRGAEALTVVEARHKNSVLFNALLKALRQDYPQTRRIHVILDDYRIHSSQVSRRAVAGHEGRIHAARVHRSRRAQSQWRGPGCAAPAAKRLLIRKQARPICLRRTPRPISMGTGTLGLIPAARPRAARAAWCQAGASLPVPVI